VNPPPTPEPTGPATPDWVRVRALFDAVEPLDAAAREQHLGACGEPAEVLAEVRSLLQAGAGSDTGFLERPAAAPAAPAPPAAVGPGLRLGPWRLVGLLGRGGMGEVWEAVRDDGQYQGRVAVKLLKAGMDSAAVLARFAQERQALARLSHPHIARLIDAGATPRGAPYVVMELVDGQPIDRACAGLPIAGRLGLFLQLADAVAYAHRNLLVHRDLKPSNVLVDRDGRVRLLDFGVAKALDPLEGADAHATLGGERPFTPLYASPEQVRGEPVSTATDIYSLGVLLYVLLTGQRPYGRTATSAAEAARSVLQEEPGRPSQAPGDGPGWAETRGQLEGDLDHIVLMALEKSPERRYASVDALAADVRAHLDGYPVAARPAGATYRVGKFIARHRWAVLAGGLGGLGLASGLVAALLSQRQAAVLGVLGLAAGLGVAMLQAREAALARDAATAARDAARQRLAELKRITTDLVFRHGDAVNLLPGGAASQEALLAETVSSLEPALAAAPDDAELQATMAAALARLAEIQGNTVTAAPERAPQARATVARALALGERAWPQRLGDWRFAQWQARARTVQAQLLRGERRLDEAVAVLERAAAEAEASLARQTEPLARAFMGAAGANLHLLRGQLLEHANLPSLGRPDEALAALALAEAHYAQLAAQPALLQALDATGPAGSPSADCYVRHQLGTLAGARALILLRQGRDGEARQAAEAALALRRRNVELEPQVVAWRDGLMVEANTLARACLGCGDAPAALAAATLARETAAALAHDEGPASKWAGVGPLLAPARAGALLALGRVAEAREAVVPALAAVQARLAADPADAVLSERAETLQALLARCDAA
jgi:hypothetical protein